MKKIKNENKICFRDIIAFCRAKYSLSEYSLRNMLLDIDIFEVDFSNFPDSKFTQAGIYKVKCKTGLNPDEHIDYLEIWADSKFLFYYSLTENEFPLMHCISDLNYWKIHIISNNYEPKRFEHIDDILYFYKYKNYLYLEVDLFNKSKYIKKDIGKFCYDCRPFEFKPFEFRQYLNGNIYLNTNHSKLVLNSFHDDILEESKYYMMNYYKVLNHNKKNILYWSVYMNVLDLHSLLNDFLKFCNEMKNEIQYKPVLYISGDDCSVYVYEDILKELCNYFLYIKILNGDKKYVYRNKK